MMAYRYSRFVSPMHSDGEGVRVYSEWSNIPEEYKREYELNNIVITKDFVLSRLPVDVMAMEILGITTLRYLNMFSYMENGLEFTIDNNKITFI